MDVKFLGGASTGTPYETGETRTVAVTAEALSAVSGYEGDTITYTATVLDSAAGKLPAAFVVSLKINGVLVTTDQALDVAVYDLATGLLTLEFAVPAAVGAFTVTLNWVEQVIAIT